MAESHGAKYFLDIPDIDLPAGTPVVGYKLFYRSAQSPTVLQRIVHGTSIMNADSIVQDMRALKKEAEEKGRDTYAFRSARREIRTGELKHVPGKGHVGLYAPRAYVYNEDAPNVMADSVKQDVGFFYWPDQALAEDYAQWYSSEYVHRDFYGIPTEKMKGRYELHRVEGIHVPKPAEDPFGQDMNEGMTMNEMMIDKEVLAAWSMTGERIDEKQSMADWVAQERERVEKWKANRPEVDYSGWY